MAWLAFPPVGAHGAGRGGAPLVVRLSLARFGPGLYASRVHGYAPCRNF